MAARPHWTAESFLRGCLAENYSGHTCGMMAMLARSCSTPILAMLMPSMTIAPLSSSCSARLEAQHCERVGTRAANGVCTGHYAPLCRGQAAPQKLSTLQFSIQARTCTWLSALTSAHQDRLSALTSEHHDR